MRTLLTAEQLDAGIDRLAVAARVRSLVLLRKAGRAEVGLEPDYVGFDIPDEFVVGYGLDFDGGFRHLPSLAALDHADIENIRTTSLYAAS